MTPWNMGKQGWVYPLFSPDSDDRLSLNFHRFVILYISCGTRSVGLGQYCLPKVSNGSTKRVNKNRMWHTTIKCCNITGGQSIDIRLAQWFLYSHLTSVDPGSNPTSDWILACGVLTWSYGGFPPTSKAGHLKPCMTLFVNVRQISVYYQRDKYILLMKSQEKVLYIA